MECPTCGSTSLRLSKGRTGLGYRCYRCRRCDKRFNERTGTPFNLLTFPTDVVLLVVRWRLQYSWTELVC